MRLVHAEAGIASGIVDPVREEIAIAPSSADVLGLGWQGAPGTLRWELFAALLEEAVHPEDRLRLAETIERLAVDTAAQSVEFRYRRPDDGRERHLRLWGVPVTSDDGRVLRVVETIVDVTEQVEAVRRAQRVAAQQEAVTALAVSLQGADRDEVARVVAEQGEAFCTAFRLDGVSWFAAVPAGGEMVIRIQALWPPFDLLSDAYSAPFRDRSWQQLRAGEPLVVLDAADLDPAEQPFPAIFAELFGVRFGLCVAVDPGAVAPGADADELVAVWSGAPGTHREPGEVDLLVLAVSLLAGAVRTARGAGSAPLPARVLPALDELARQVDALEREVSVVEATLSPLAPERSQPGGAVAPFSVGALGVDLGLGVSEADVLERLERLARGLAQVGSLSNRDETPRARAQRLPGYERLSERQQEVLGLLADGHRVGGIAVRLGVSSSTVRNHVSTILRMLGLRNQTELAERLHAPGVSPAGASGATVPPWRGPTDDPGGR